MLHRSHNYETEVRQFISASLSSNSERLYNYVFTNLCIYIKYDEKLKFMYIYKI